MKMHRPQGGPTLVTMRDGVTNSPPTHIGVLEPNGQLVRLATLPDELSSAQYLDAVDGRLYLSTTAGLFRSRSVMLP